MKKTKAEFALEYEKLGQELEYDEAEMEEKKSQFEKIEEELREVVNEHVQDQKKAKEQHRQ